MEIELLLFTEALTNLVKAGRIMFKDKIKSSLTTSIDSTIGEKLQEKYGGGFSASTIKFSKGKIKRATNAKVQGKIVTVTVAEMTVLTIQSFIKDSINSSLLNEEIELKKRLRSVLKRLNNFSEVTEHNVNGTSTKPIPIKIPKHLIGVYYGYFLRPRNEKSDAHISKLALLLKEASAELKTTKLDYKSDAIVYEHLKPILELCFVGEGDLKKHKFQLSLTYNKLDFLKYPVIEGIYGGTDPQDTIPVCGKIILERVNSKTEDKLEKLFQKMTPQNFEDENTIADFLKGKRNVFDFLKGSNYIEDVSFFKNYSAHHDMGNYGIAGVYSIFSLDSSEFDLSIGVMKIDRLGGVDIKGGSDRTYKGFAKIFTDEILAINVFERVIGQKDSEDYFFNYLVKVLWDDKGNNNHGFYHGVRTIVIKNESIKKPSTARIIIKKETRTFEEIQFRRINILPYEFDRKNRPKRLIIKDDKEPIDYDGQEKFIKSVIKYLQGDANNLMTAKGVKQNSFTKQEDYALVYFNAAINFANKDMKKEARINFEKAILHGFYGEDYWTILNEEKTKLTNEGREIVESIKHKEFFGVKYFYFED